MEKRAHSARSGAPRGAVNTRLRREIRAALEKSAEANGLTLSAEIERRLEQSMSVDLIQKAVADGIAAHEAAKAEKMRRGFVVTENGAYGTQQSANSYLSLYGLNGTQNS